MPRSKHAVPIERFTVRSQEEVGRALGITAMRVCQLEKSALRKLRAAFETQGFEQREPARPFPHGIFSLLAQQEREQWMWFIMQSDCDLSESKSASKWKAQWP